MGRKPLIIPPARLNLHLPSDLFAEIEKRLWSDAEGRVPKGAYQDFFVQAAIAAMRQLPLDLAPYAGSMPSEFVVYAYPAAREKLKHLLERSTHDAAQS